LEAFFDKIRYRKFIRTTGFTLTAFRAFSGFHNIFLKRTFSVKNILSLEIRAFLSCCSTINFYKLFVEIPESPLTSMFEIGHLFDIQTNHPTNGGIHCYWILSGDNTTRVYRDYTMGPKNLRGARMKSTIVRSALITGHRSIMTSTKMIWCIW
jgi:hypothetical protein